jgi:predicted TIM-barrel fold metal-dependent hydrolase
MKELAHMADWMISVDDHVIEPPSVWQSRLPSKYRERGPRFVDDDLGEAWLFEDKRMPISGLWAVVGRDKTDYSPDPISMADMRPSCYDPKARIEDMNVDGVLSSVCYPSFARFCGQTFLEAKDKELGFECVKAYNDWIIDEWCGSVAKDRLVPMIIIPHWDPPLAAKEIERCAAKGARGLSFSENPAKLGLPSIYDADKYWDPVFDAAAEAEIVLGTHIGSSSWIPTSSDDASHLSTIVWGAASVAECTLTDWLLSGNLMRFPKLKISLSEGGVGWIPYFLERAKRSVERHQYWAGVRGNFSDEDSTFKLAAEGTVEQDYRNFDPYQMFKDNLFSCAFCDTEEFAFRNIDEIGVDNITLESDFPHSDGSWPNSMKVVKENIGHLSEEYQYKLLQGNARKLFRINPAIPATP